jgi:hypothetical protein
MRTKILATTLGAALVLAVGSASASEPVQLTPSQMDGVTAAGFDRHGGLMRLHYLPMKIQWMIKREMRYLMRHLPRRHGRRHGRNPA